MRKLESKWLKNLQNRVEISMAKINKKLNFKGQTPRKDVLAVIKFIIEREVERNSLWEFDSIHSKPESITQKNVEGSYTYGLCIHLHAILKECFREMETWLEYDSWFGMKYHIVGKVGEFFYDIEGARSRKDFDYTLKQVGEKELKAQERALNDSPYFNKYTKGDIEASKEFLKKYKEVMAVINFLIKREMQRGGMFERNEDVSYDMSGEQGVKAAYHGGLCGNLFLVLKECFPEAESYQIHDPDYIKDHILTKIDNVYYDINGVYTSAELKKKLEGWMGCPTEAILEPIDDEILKDSVNKNWQSMYTEDDAKKAKKSLSTKRRKEVGVNERKETEQSGD